nr:minor tail protein [Microvirus sp.]
MAILETILPTLISAGASLLGNWLSGSHNNTSSAMNQNSMNQTTGNSQMSQSGTQQSYGSGSESQIGSIDSIGNLLANAMKTPTSNNWGQTSDFNAGQAQTANNLQTGLWSAGNIMSMLSNAQAQMMSQNSQTAAMKYNSAEAQKQRDWQTEMANTAYQRGVADLKAAGLNPVLAAYNGFGAGTPSGGYGSVSGGQNFQQANIASSPAMHTASMQAMFDYGNNTAQFLDNAMKVINNAKQTKNWEQANVMNSIMESVGSSSAKSVSEMAQNLQSTSDTTKNAGNLTKLPTTPELAAGLAAGAKAGAGTKSKKAPWVAYTSMIPRK